MLHLRNEEQIPIFAKRMNKQEEVMDRIYRALGFAVALGASGLMFALTLA
jgi:hypothetical protein